MIKFLSKEGCKRQKSVNVWSPFTASASNYCTVTRWFNEFTRGHQSLEDDFRSGRSSDAVNNPISIATASSNWYWIIYCIRRHCRKTAYDKSKTESVKRLQKSYKFYLRVLKHSSRTSSYVKGRWVPQNLSMHNRHQRVASCQELLDLCTSGKEKFRCYLVTGDET